MTAHVIETRDLTMFYGKQRGISGVNLQVNQGEIFGFLGPNGAGKTTTQRILLDVIRPTSGSASIFGLDCEKDGSEIRKQVGYLPGDLSLYPNMRASAFLAMLDSLYGNVSQGSYRKELIERLDLDPKRKMKEYSRGNRQKVGIVAAFMNKPQLLVLDEPTSGLDPLVQQTVHELIKETRAEGRTVFLSSHNLPEVQAVCDRVGIIRQGVLSAVETVETLTRQQFKRLRITTRQAIPPSGFELDGVAELSREGSSVVFEVRQNLDQLMTRAAALGITDLETLPTTLEEIFLAFYGRENKRGSHA